MEEMQTIRPLVVFVSVSVICVCLSTLVPQITAAFLPVHNILIRHSLLRSCKQTMTKNQQPRVELSQLALFWFNCIDNVKFKIRNKRFQIQLFNKINHASLLNRSILMPCVLLCCIHHIWTCPSRTEWLTSNTVCTVVSQAEAALLSFPS